MKTLRTLYRYELRKLLSRRPAWIVAILLAAITIHTALPSHGAGSTFSVTDRSGQTVERVLSGAEQRAALAEGERRISGQPMDEAFFRNLRAACAGNGQYELREHWDQVCWFYLVDNSYLGPYSLLAYEWNLDPATTTAEQFYQARQETIRAQMGPLSPDEQSFWTDMEAKVEKPFVYRYGGWYPEFLHNVYGLSSLLPLLAAVCLCGVFSDERRVRTESLLFSCRQSRLPLFLAKLLAGLTCALAASLGILAFCVLPLVFSHGAEGFQAPLQLWESASSLPLTVGRAVLLMMGLLVLYALACGALSMLLSVATKNTLAALLGPVLLMILQARLGLPGQAAEYLPNQLFNGTAVFRSFQLVSFPGTFLTVLQVAPVLYAVLGAGLLALCWLCWRRWAVQG